MKTNDRSAPVNKALTDENLLKHDCGTLACAVGYACSDPQFQALGLQYGVKEEDGSIRSGYFCPVYTPDSNKPNTMYSSWGAVNAFFQLRDSPWDEAEALFSECGVNKGSNEFANNSTLMDAPWPSQFEDRDNRYEQMDLWQKAGLDDRRLVLMRIRNYMKLKGWIDEATFNAMLAAEELPAPDCVEVGHV